MEHNFNADTRATLKGFTFADLYSLEQSDLVELVGSADGSKLYTRLRTQPPSGTNKSPGAAGTSRMRSSLTTTIRTLDEEDEDGSGSESDRALVTLDSAELERKRIQRKLLQRRKIERRIARESALARARAEAEKRAALRAKQREEERMEEERQWLSQQTQEYVRNRQRERQQEEENRKLAIIEEFRAKEAEVERERRKKLEEEEEIRRIQRMNHLKPTMAAAVKLAEKANTRDDGSTPTTTVGEDGGTAAASSLPGVLTADGAQEYIEFQLAKRRELFESAQVRKQELENLKRALLEERDGEFQKRVEAIQNHRKQELEKEQLALLKQRTAKEESRVSAMKALKAKIEGELEQKSAELNARLAAAKQKAYASDAARQAALDEIRMQHDQHVAKRLSEHADRVERHRQEKRREKQLLLQKAAILKELYAAQASEEIRMMVAARDEARERAAKINAALPYTPKTAGDFSVKLAALNAQLDAEAARNQK